MCTRHQDATLCLHRRQMLTLSIIHGTTLAPSQMRSGSVRRDYISALQARPKWRRVEKDLEINDVVLLVDEPCQ